MGTEVTEPMSGNGKKDADSELKPVSQSEKVSHGGSALVVKTSQAITTLPNGCPVLPAQFKYVESDLLPGRRPVALSTFETYATLPGGRPIAASHFEVVGLLSGSRPISARHFEYVDSENLPGGRPIALHTIDYNLENTLPGGRPIATNRQDVNISTLIGYLD